MSRADDDAPRLRRQNAALLGQVQHLVKLEKRLLEARQNTAAQLERMRALSELALRVNALLPAGPILGAALQTLANVMPFEQGIGLIRTGDELRVIALHAAPGRDCNARDRLGGDPAGLTASVGPSPLLVDLLTGAEVSRRPSRRTLVAPLYELYGGMGEDASRTYAFIPITREGTLQGALVLRTPEADLISPHEELPSGEGDLAFLTLVANHVAGALRNVELQQDIAKRERRHAALVDALPDMLVRIRGDGTILDFRASILEHVPLTPEQIVGANLHDIELPVDLYAMATQAMARLLASTKLQEFRYTLPTPSGPAHYECRMTLASDDECVAIIRNITTRVEAEARLGDTLRQLESLAYIDSLTRVFNLRAVREHLDQALVRAREQDQRLAVLFLDLDGFKAVNDAHGHETGDAVLRGIAARLARSLRTGDFLGRIGGDEFLVVLDRCQENGQAATVARKLITAVGAREAEETKLAPVGASIGIALFPADGTQLDTLIQHADEAMYRAKRAGGNQFAFIRPDLQQHAANTRRS